MNHSPEEILHAKLNGETAKLHWQELQRYFARGVVIKVATGMDLVEVATKMAQDDKVSVSNWLERGLVAKASTEDAMLWDERGTVFWAVVAAPWVLVQEVASSDS